ncbi:hypothetical protein V9T40_000350 [Parthenolecanium corni]|uniref:Uncharacterized protein n=1 Tax=Parthenolecanium corni TaxID=536013 RepID=A0AAN9TQ98_9HEMI
MSENTSQNCGARAVANGGAAAAAAAVGASNSTCHGTSKTVFSSSSSESARACASASVRFRGSFDGRPNGEQRTGANCNSQTTSQCCCITSSAPGQAGQNSVRHC